MKPIRLINGVWTTVTEDEAEKLHDQWKLENPKTDKDYTRETRQKDRDLGKTVEKTCGNCKSIKYIGVNEAKLEYGSCDRFRESNRLAVRNTECACCLWKFRGKNKLETERFKAESIKSSISKVKVGRR
jgi:hypothetical protein